MYYNVKILLARYSLSVQKVNYFTFCLSSVSLDFVWTWMIRKSQDFWNEGQS